MTALAITAVVALAIIALTELGVLVYIVLGLAATTGSTPPLWHPRGPLE